MNQISLPRCVTGRAPGWAETTDVVVVGSGIAGLSCALHLREAGLHVTVVTKVNIDDGSTRWAQGGIAAVLDPEDSVAAHAADTLAAGAGLCDPAVVEIAVREGPVRVRELLRWGAKFDRNPDGSLMLTREGGHRARRIAHAGGDATGLEVQRALCAAVRRDPWIRLIEHALVLDLLTDEDERACGVTLHVLGEGTPDGVGSVLAHAVVLATGGIGQIFDATTNPAVSTGDGVALALRAGAAVTGLEFVQFHPTALYLGTARTAQLPLVTEALRGEGARLVDGEGKRFMVGQHELAELAPRDIVAKAIYRVMLASGTDHVFLDARHLPDIETRFPSVTAACRSAGIDPRTDLIPVAPAAHYASGGVRTDWHGRTSIPGLYACGEVACTGLHGANRLASNSLLEALVFARRIAAAIAATVRAAPAPGRAPAPAVEKLSEGWVVPGEIRGPVARAMSRGAGVLRNEGGLASAAATLASLSTGRATPSTEAWEATNQLTVAAVLSAAATARTETRGCHWRDDYPISRDEWLGHLVATLGASGEPVLRFEPLNHQRDSAEMGNYGTT